MSWLHAEGRKRSWFGSSDLYCFTSFLRRPASVKVNEKPRRLITSATTPTSDNDMFDSPRVLGELGRPEGFLLLLFFERMLLRATSTKVFAPLPSAHPLSWRGSNTHAYLGICAKGVSPCVFVGVRGHISEPDAGGWGVTECGGLLQHSADYCRPARPLQFIWCRPGKRGRLGAWHGGGTPSWEHGVMWGEGTQAALDLKSK